MAESFGAPAGKRSPDQKQPLGALLGQRLALKPTLDAAAAFGLAGQAQQRAQQVGDAFGFDRP
jgi:hypothetical protein